MTSNSPPRSATRRFVLRASLLLGGSVALFGGSVFWHRGIRDGRLTSAGKEVLRAIGLAIFDDLLPRDPALRSAALDRHVANMDAVLANLPPIVRLQTSTLLGALGNVAGRAAMTGMVTRWGDASVPELQSALEKLRLSPLQGTQVVYHSLRDLSCVSFFSDPPNWKLIGYSGQNDV